jgi:RNA polymerase sigma-70 factor (ECF subfamily)
MRTTPKLFAVAAVVTICIAAEAPKKKPPANNSGFGITSVAESLPVVVKTEPQAGSTDVDAAATTELKVTFSKDMEPKNFSWVQTSKETYPTTTGKPKFLDDRRTCVLPVKLEAGKTYVIWLNKEPYTSMMDKEGRKAVPYLLVFETKK